MAGWKESITGFVQRHSGKILGVVSAAQCLVTVGFLAAIEAEKARHESGHGHIEGILIHTSPYVLGGTTAMTAACCFCLLKLNPFGAHSDNYYVSFDAILAEIKEEQPAYVPPTMDGAGAGSGFGGGDTAPSRPLVVAPDPTAIMDPRAPSPGAPDEVHVRWAAEHTV